MKISVVCFVCNKFLQKVQLYKSFHSAAVTNPASPPLPLGDVELPDSEEKLSAPAELSSIIFSAPSLAVIASSSHDVRKKPNTKRLKSKRIFLMS